MAQQEGEEVRSWQRWLREPQTMVPRKALLQIHLWTGLAAGLYITAISLSGSVLVYRNELYRVFSPAPVIVAASGPALSPESLSDAARRAYPEYVVGNVAVAQAVSHAVEITLVRGDDVIGRLFDPFTGADLGNPIPAGYRFTTWLMDFHGNLLAGETGRRVNGVGGLLVIVLCVTGAVIWWPGVRSWRRSLAVDVRANTKRLIWTVHSALGFWFFAFVLLWGVTGAYLAFAGAFATFFDYIQPFDETMSERLVDRIQYWLGYLHFGRLGGRGIPGCGRGLCDSFTKATWAVVGLIPPAMFVTGALIWWNRGLNRRIRTGVGPRAEEHLHR